MPSYKAPDNTKLSGYSLHEIDPEFAHMLPTGSVEITEAEAQSIRIANIPAPAQLSPLEQIRAIEAAKADDTAKVIRQTLLMAVVDKAMERPEVVAMLQDYPAEAVKAQVVSALVDTDPGFKLLYNLEQEIEPLRSLVP